MSRNTILFLIGVYLLIGYVYWSQRCKGVLAPMCTILTWPYLVWKTELVK